LRHLDPGQAPVRQGDRPERLLLARAEVDLEGQQLSRLYLADVEGLGQRLELHLLGLGEVADLDLRALDTADDLLRGGGRACGCEESKRQQWQQEAGDG